MKHKQLGLSLVELLVALTIGGFLIIGAVTVQSQTRKTFSVNEAQARLQETARFAMSVLEPEAQLAGLLGYSNNVVGAGFITSAGAEPVYAKDLLLGKSSGAPAVFDYCGANFTMNVMTPIYAENGTWTIGCDSTGGGHIPKTDTLTLRFAGVTEAEPKKGRMQVMARRLQTDKIDLFMSGSPPHAIKEGVDEVRDYYVKTYYVAADSEGRPGLPSLRVKQLIAKDGDGVWDDQEVVRGVEDLQVELGVDPGQDKNFDGIIDVDPDSGVANFTNGDVSIYVPPGDAVLKAGQVAAVRLWIRVRAEELEPGFRDRRTYTYGSVNGFTPSDGYRRVLISRTIFVRNTRTFPSS